MAQFKAQCIFDKPARRTAEHIFGQWMRDQFPSAFRNTEHLTSFTDYSTGVPVPTMAKGRMNRNGSPHAQQLRLVCESCNNEWMSRLQNQAKEPLTSLMRNDWSKLDVPSIKSVAAWVAMVTMCLEFADLKTQAIPLAERQFLMSTGTPPPDWIICLGRCRTDNAPGTMWHRAAMLETEKTQSPPQQFQPNYQTTTICLEAAFAHVLSGPVALLPDPKAYAESLGVRVFWPLPQTAPSEPLVFTPEGITRVAMQFWRDNGLVTDLLHGTRSPFIPNNTLPGQLPQSLISLLLRKSR
ncbi:hypothetical protein FXV83_12890 [Bradyrhizobium hipponense]|uniref:Uncharacterized protein n=1 Tax=Bradyrhizobium hipponense TaxID=2605638 RepID=A0A5S4YQE6_9BRAD|nr:hypothetical protein [Bradyrhizobium hipponense]TYO66152.1 hypothetical protein FXV83_12890 [Bradyrhizobium hipponense]